MFKKSLLMVSLVISLSTIAMDPNKNPFNNNFKKTNDMYDRVKNNQNNSNSGRSWQAGAGLDLQRYRMSVSLQ